MSDIELFFIFIVFLLTFVIGGLIYDKKLLKEDIKHLLQKEEYCSDNHAESRILDNCRDELIRRTNIYEKQMEKTYEYIKSLQEELDRYKAANLYVKSPPPPSPVKRECTP